MGSCNSIPLRRQRQPSHPKSEDGPSKPTSRGLRHRFKLLRHRVKPSPTSPQLDKSSQELIYRLLDELDSDTWKPLPTEDEKSPQPSDRAVRIYVSQMRNGLSALLGHGPISGNQSWSDAMAYARAVIQDPKDTVERSKATWTRSCSSIQRELMTRFGPATISTAIQGCRQLVDDHYHGKRLAVSHVDKKTSFREHFPMSKPSISHYPASSPLAIGAYECAFLSCSLISSAWLSPEEAMKFASICHLSVCDDYYGFTGTETEVRVRLVALAIGAAFEFGDEAVEVLMDGTALQAVGSSKEVSLRAAMAWRAVNGAATAYNGHVLANDSLEDGLVSPQVIMAIHDMFDWRSDLAAGNHENGFSVAYGLGLDDPFHDYLEEILLLASSHPKSGAYAISAITLASFTACRYSSYKYFAVDVDLPAPCPRCIKLVRNLTEEAGFSWEPKTPPGNLEDGERVRKLCQSWADRYEDHGLIQEGLSWFQSLIETGRIHVLDALVKIPAVDEDAEWA
ncbi:hypothetical protein BBK36DRAFT_1121193 [Trichoderma citrinoviride]|uniref:Terpenoid synthase n=1 Tax=Trichoderma citrinoviride TaxID=58853 RepID=A0A2T4B8P1_9HYPO|nr:hypothetical protein BBK36DRAFT_1121193 [Trichoderma citrinoviride]PTB65579.1 hypothetical protein BBK36DRAFT_1121193 [Trichoderma citrinoviride]